MLKLATWSKVNGIGTGVVCLFSCGKPLFFWSENTRKCHKFILQFGYSRTPTKINQLILCNLNTYVELKSLFLNFKNPPPRLPTN